MQKTHLILVHYILCIFLNFYKAQNSHFSVIDSAVFIRNFSNKHFSLGKIDVKPDSTVCAVLDSAFVYGLNYVLNPNDFKQSGNYELVITSLFQSQADNISDLIFCYQIDKENKNVYWQGIDVNKKSIKLGSTFKFADTLKIPKKFISKNYTVKFYFWLNTKRNVIHFLKYKLNFNKISVQKEFLLPEFDSTSFQSISYSNGLNYDSIQKTLFIANDKKKCITKSIFLLLEAENVNQKNIVSKTLQFNEQNKYGQKYYEAENEYFKALVFHTSNSLKKGKFNIKIKFNRKLKIKRLALVMEMSNKPKTLCNQNRKLSNDFSDDLYSLNKQGFLFGNNGDFIVYHTPQLSSMQYFSKKNYIVYNLDYYLDHLMLNFPLKENANNFKIDKSKTEVDINDTINGAFDYFINTQTTTIPRFMKNPYGFLSTFVFTEHADFSDIRLHRATYFGNEKITEAAKATGGFVKWEIPVTKSIFYNNPEKINNNQFNGAFKSEIANMSLPEFKYFINQLHQLNYDICLHTPEENTTTTQNINEALTYFKTNFNSKCWIDHGYNNKLKNNREDIVCDGANKNSEFFMLNKWEQHGVKYFWNCFFEDTDIFIPYNFNLFKNPYLGYANLLPTPDFWQHKNISDKIWLWPTNQLLFIYNPTMWAYTFSETNLNDFYDNWDVLISHCYTARVDSNSCFYTYDSIKQAYIVHPELDKVLKKLSEYKNKKLINVTTINDFLEYNINLQNIKYTVVGKNYIQLKNNNNTTIKGLSMALHTQRPPIVLNKNIKFKKVEGGDVIFWFDLLPNESVEIKW
ncbi:MAG: hypothetical protein JSU07_04260 [Bacteroidetes bacterium]|nr:hypothetical protein [Bacteroidota bacterium]